MDFIIPERFYDLKKYIHANIDFSKEADQLQKVLDNASKENDVQKYIKQNEKWFIPGALFKDYDFGHHTAYIVPEQPLGSEYKVDYMLLGNNSIGHQIVFVEFEDINVDFKQLNSNTETVAVRKGITQIRDWKRWIDNNRVYFLNSCGLSDIANSIPSWGFYYCLVVSRRNRMDDLSNQLRGQLQNEMKQFHIATYDRLVDNIRLLENGF